MTAILITAGAVVLAVGALRMRALSRRLARLERKVRGDGPPPHVDRGPRPPVDRERRWGRPPVTVLRDMPTVQQLAALGKPLSRFGG